jgi:hypothetical protein
MYALSRAVVRPVRRFAGGILTSGTGAAVHESASSTAFLVENLGNKSQHNPKRNGAVKIQRDYSHDYG